MITEPGHAPNRGYMDTDGERHLNGSRLFLNENGRNIGDGIPAAGGASLALTVLAHGERTVVADQAAGVTFTLPSATAAVVGSCFRIVVSVSLTSGNLIVAVANGNDFMVGLITAISDDGAGGPVKGWATANTGTLATESDTVTLNRTTTGVAAKGQWLEFECVAANTWAVRGSITQTGTEATPFSAAV